MQSLHPRFFLGVALKELLVLIVEQQFAALNKCCGDDIAAHIQRIALADKQVGVFAHF